MEQDPGNSPADERNQASSDECNELILSDREWHPTDGCAPVLLDADILPTGLGRPVSEDEPYSSEMSFDDDDDPDSELAVALTFTDRIRRDKVEGWVIEVVEGG